MQISPLLADCLRAIVIVTTISLLFGTSRKKPHNIVAGGLYAYKEPDGNYRVEKVLVVDKYAVHLRIYKNVFPTLPTDIDPSILSISMTAEDLKNHRGGSPLEIGFGHVPIAIEGFFKAKPILLKKSEVTKDELDGYNYWKSATARVKD